MVDAGNSCSFHTSLFVFVWLCYWLIFFNHSWPRNQGFCYCVFCVYCEDIYIWKSFNCISAMATFIEQMSINTNNKASVKFDKNYRKSKICGALMFWFSWNRVDLFGIALFLICAKALPVFYAILKFANLLLMISSIIECQLGFVRMDWSFMFCAFILLDPLVLFSNFK